MLKNSLTKSVNIIIICFVFLLSVNLKAASAQNTLEGGGKNFLAKTAEVKIEKPSSVTKLPGAEIIADEKIAGCIKEYLNAIFEKDYERAVSMMADQSKAESAIAKLENWRESFMAPANIKILNIKSTASSDYSAAFTFEYKNPSGVSDLIRGRIIIAVLNSKLKIKELVPAQRAAETSNTVAPNFSTPNNSSAYSHSKPQNSSTGSTAANTSNGSPDIASMISALSGSNAGASSGNMNVDPSALLNIMNQMMNDPDVLELATNPKLMEIAKDPSIMDTLLSGNKNAISNNPKIQELMNDPAVRKIIEKMKNKMENKGGSNENPSGSDPSQNINVDSIFE
ncbi:MAG: hypothetical protein QMC67_17175 [Candidatus Wallbacteria bacterium]